MQAILHDRYKLPVTQQTVAVLVEYRENRVDQVLGQVRTRTYFHSPMKLVWNGTKFQVSSYLKK